MTAALREELPSRRVLTLDLGNTSGSLAVVGARSASILAAGPADALAEWWPADLERCESGALSAVGGHGAEARAAELLGRSCARVLVRPDAGLVLDIDSPETCGSDRQYAMRAALARTGGPVLVVDAGTALTVDAGTLRDGQPVFLGGSISLGPGSTAAAITARGARLPDFDFAVDSPALGRSTLEALAAGVAVGFRGAVRELARGIAGEAFGPGPAPAVHLCGGARAFARGVLLEEFGGALVEEPLLVHLGLALAARDTDGP